MQITERLRGRRAVEVRARRLRTEPLCRLCSARGVITPAVEIDHIVPLHRGGSDDDANVQALCKACHEIKTREDMGYVLTDCDADGLPLDPHHPWNREGGGPVSPAVGLETGALPTNRINSGSAT